MQKADTFVFFDFDGVIADSFKVASALANKFCVHLTPDVYRRNFEKNIFDAHAEIRGAVHDERCNHDLDWFGEYGQMFPGNVGAFDGAIEAVRAVAADNRLVVVSSGPEGLIRNFFATVGIAECFEDVLGHESHRSKVEKIKMIFNERGAEPHMSLMITDTLGDIREAREAGVDALGVTWGFHNRSTLERGEPFLIIDSPAEIPHSVEQYFGRNA